MLNADEIQEDIVPVIIGSRDSFPDFKTSDSGEVDTDGIEPATPVMTEQAAKWYQM